MKRDLAQLEELSTQRRKELLEAPAARLRDPNANWSAVASHVEDAQRDLVPVRETLAGRTLRRWFSRRNRRHPVSSRTGPG